MSGQRSWMPDSYPCCPRFDPFHAACRHPLHQTVVRELSVGERPLYETVRAEAMRELEARLR